VYRWISDCTHSKLKPSVTGNQRIGCPVGFRYTPAVAPV
jgi:hypothetical protein